MIRIIIAVLLSCGAVAPALAQTDSSGTARITYVTTSTAYVDAGTAAGIAVGDTIEVVRDGAIVATLVVTAVSSRRAACERLDAAVELRVGDSVRFVPHVAVSPPAVVPSTLGQSARKRGGKRRIRGRIGIRYVSLRDRSRFDRGYSEPGIDGRLHGSFGEHWSLSVDARVRRTYRAVTESSRTRVYRLFGEWRSGEAGARVTAGRQFSTSLSSVSVFDGVRAEWVRPRWRVGLFTGTQPEPLDWGFSSNIREHGIYSELSSRPDRANRWTVTLAGVTSYSGSVVNREYVSLQGRWVGPRAVGFMVQEVDLNRDWKKDAGEPTVSLTGTQLSGRVRLTKRWDVDGGFDNRRRVRLFRDRVDPETEFDDSYRQGMWLGVNWRPRPVLRAGLNWRRSSGGGSGDVDLMTMRAGVRVPRARNLDVGLRSTLYRNQWSDGRLFSGGISGDVTHRLNLALAGGQRTEEVRDVDVKEVLSWVSVDMDYFVTHGWHAAATVEWSDGDDESTTQIYTSLVWRF